MAGKDNILYRYETEQQKNPIAIPRKIQYMSKFIPVILIPLIVIAFSCKKDEIPNDHEMLFIEDFDGSHQWNILGETDTSSLHPGDAYGAITGDRLLLDAYGCTEVSASYSLHSTDLFNTEYSELTVIVEVNLFTASPTASEKNKLEIDFMNFDLDITFREDIDDRRYMFRYSDGGILPDGSTEGIGYTFTNAGASAFIRVTTASESADCSASATLKLESVKIYGKV